MKPSEDKPDHECEYYLDEESIVYGCECGLIQVGECQYYPDSYVEQLRLKLKEKDQEIESHRKTIVHQRGLLSLQDGIVSKLEQSNRELLKHLKGITEWFDIGCYVDDNAQIMIIDAQKLIEESEGTTKKE